MVQYIEEEDSDEVTHKESPKTSTPFSSSAGSRFSSENQEIHRTSSDVVINIEEDNSDDQFRSDKETTKFSATNFVGLVLASLLHAVIEFLAFLTRISSFSMPFVIVFLFF